MAETTTRPRGRDSTPDNPAQLSKGTWMDTLKRTLREFKEDDLTLLAAALTYYGILSLFPALLVLLSLLGLAGTDTIDTLLKNIGSLTPGAARDVVTNPGHAPPGFNNKGGFAFVAGLVGALWSGSGYVGGFMKASNVIYEVEEGRKFWK